MKKSILITAVFGLLLAACGTNSNNSNQATIATASTAQEAPLSFELLKDSLRDKMVEVDLELLVAKGKGSAAINEAINQELASMLTMGAENGANLRNYKDMFAYLQKAHKESYEGQDVKELGPSINWSFGFKMRNHYQSAGYLCMAFESYSFAGGAHPNSYNGYVSVDLATGKVLKNTDLVDSAKVMPAVEAAFRTHWKAELKGAKNYEEAGFMLSGNQLPLPAQIGINDKKAIFYYNPYEVGPYVMGPTVLEIPLEQLAGGLKVK